jgi:hypothetical protein
LKKNFFIWGDFSYGNFGDTLQALLIADYLASLGKTVRIYNTAEPLKSHKNEPSVEKGIIWCDKCILGGGAIFSRLNLTNKIHLLYDKEIGLLTKSVSKYKKPVFSVSVGCGQEKVPVLTENQRNLLVSPFFKGGTVRLHGDVNALGCFKPFIYFPDLVFLARTVTTMPYFSSRKRQPRLLLCLPTDFYFFNFSAVKTLLNWQPFCIFFSAFTFFLKTYQFKPKDRGLDSTIVFRNIHRFLGFLKEHKDLLLVSNKLHLFVAFLSFGGLPFSFFGYQKTRSFLKEQNLGFLTGMKGLFFLLLSIFSKSFRFSLKSLVETLVNGKVKAAYKHYDFIKKHV